MTGLFTDSFNQIASSSKKAEGKPAQLRYMRPMIGMLCIIEAASDHVDLTETISHAYEALRLTDELMHPVRGADLARINQFNSQAVKVHEWTWQVMQLAAQLSQLTDGVFDPCLPSQLGCMADVELLPDNRVICHSQVRMDLGGIAKGFAIDRAIDVLKNSGCSNALVNMGGDMRVLGEAQTMYVRYGDQLLQYELCNQALAVSAFNHPDRPSEHQGYYLRNLTAPLIHHHVAVLADSAAIADALTKCVMWCDNDVVRYLCKTFNASVLLPVND